MRRKWLRFIVVFLIIALFVTLVFLLFNNPSEVQSSKVQAESKAVLVAEGDPLVHNFITEYNGSVGSVEVVNQSYFQVLQVEQPVIYGGLSVLSWPVYVITFNSSETPSSVLVVVSDGEILRVFPVAGILK
jgi:hypothetical protein